MGLREIWRSFTAEERKNIAFYVSGLMLYKLAFEIWTGSLTTIALTRFHSTYHTTNTPSTSTTEIDENTPVGILGALQSLNLLFQCLGTGIAAWGLRMGWTTKKILVCTVFCGVGISAAVVGMDVGTGGRWRVGSSDEEGEGSMERYGAWPGKVLIGVFALAGVVAGGVELVRKVVPREIIGEGEQEEEEEEGEEREGNEGGEQMPGGYSIPSNTAIRTTPPSTQIYDYQNAKQPKLEKLPSAPNLGTKLRRLDALVHIFYELAGTAGAFLSAELNLKIGSNFAIIAVPGIWVFACVVWLVGMGKVSCGMDSTGHSRKGDLDEEVVESAIDNEEEEEGQRRIGREDEDVARKVRNGEDRLQMQMGQIDGNVYPKRSFWGTIKNGIHTFFHTLHHGAHILFSTPHHAWLPFSYSLSLYAHRYLENGLAPAIAKYVYNEPAYYQIIVGGSNLGELIGALTVFLLAESVKSPVWWVRLDAVILAVGGWVVARWWPPIDPITNKVSKIYAWKLAAIFLPISLGWAAGDVSLVAHIQATLNSNPKSSSNSNPNSDSESRPTPAPNSTMDIIQHSEDHTNDYEYLPRSTSSTPQTPPANLPKKTKPKPKPKLNPPTISSLGAVMAVLYTIYILLFSLLNPLLGIYTDSIVHSYSSFAPVSSPHPGFNGIADAREGIRNALLYISGIQFTLIAVVVGGSTVLCWEWVYCVLWRGGWRKKGRK